VRKKLGLDLRSEKVDGDRVLRIVQVSTPTRPSAARGQGSSPLVYPIMDKPHFDRTDYSVVVKNRAPPPNSWRWEIYRAGRSSPIEQSSVYFHTMATANRAGKEALKQLLDKLFV
jgi:hypothetical protein